MKKIKILVAIHKKYEMPKDDIYFPIHVGREGKDDIGYQGDHSGDNISSKNENYCELTGLYWAWKNIDCDYIGLSHYRRYFTVKSRMKRIVTKKNKLNLILDKTEIEQLLNDYNLILPIKRNYYIETIRSHYKNAHHIEDLEETKKIIDERYPDYTESFNTVMNGRKIHLYNMFVMKKEDFDAYCEWLFDILFELEKKVDVSSYDNYQKRLFGFISERLFNVWLINKGFSTVDIPVVNIEKINWIDKIKNFLKRKVS